MDYLKKVFPFREHSPTHPATPEEIIKGEEYYQIVKNKTVVKNLEKQAEMMPYYIGGFCFLGSMIPLLMKKIKIKGDNPFGKILTSRMGMGVFGGMFGFNISSMIQLNILRRDDPDGIILKDMFECVQLKEKAIITEELAQKIGVNNL